MSYDEGRFLATYLRGARLPLPFGVQGWQLVRVGSDRARLAIDLTLEGPTGTRLLVFVERRLDGTESLARTRFLQLSYYDDGAVEGALAARLVRTLASVLEQVEQRVGDAASQAALARAEQPVLAELELRVNRDCNEECVFCNTPAGSETILPGRAQILAALRAERAAGQRVVTFTGREPTLDPSLPEYLEEAVALGYERRRVATNGTTLAHPPTLARLLAAGMNGAKISLHTFDASTFRSLVGAPRLLDKALEGLGRLGEHPSVEVQIVVVLTRLNLAELPALIRRLAGEYPWARQVTVSPMAPVGDGARHVELMPRLGALAGPLREAIDVATAAGMHLIVPARCGAPLCAMPAGYEAFNQDHRNVPGDNVEPGKGKLPACATCKWDSRCTGTWSAYLARHQDLRPIPR
jgi:MoaA/NifB/PqqE/SkfB family radical SAM enzyme